MQAALRVLGTRARGRRLDDLSQKCGARTAHDLVVAHQVDVADGDEAFGAKEAAHDELMFEREPWRFTVSAVADSLFFVAEKHYQLSV